ncbi:hypothetical protein [Candidatus Nanohalococcus occultus]|uniref:C2H2-type domain-containing protein n=1 Tax=Candidatus Nanohalococcus occultus TaxID=2978047 RepID=A0ABY8CDZ9_9ARCH|nr:hypothetical protein SVXNc_0419 [Candidatus Nanohaloarchaeota archaeon SVXNc]
MSKDRFECPECGENFSSETYLKEHFKVEHPGKHYRQLAGRKFSLPRLEKSFSTGILTGLMIAAGLVIAFQGYQAYSYDPVEVTVVTCDNCSYERFKGATERYFDVSYSEVNYDSERGRALSERYELNYVPGFIFGKDIEDKKNFTRVRNALVEFEDAYVMSDTRNEAAQRFSKGISLN